MQQHQALSPCLRGLCLWTVWTVWTRQADRSATMTSALMAWVRIALSLAQLSNAESHRYARGRLAGQDDLLAGSVQVNTASVEQGFPTPVWYFLKGETTIVLHSHILFLGCQGWKIGDQQTHLV